MPRGKVKRRKRRGRRSYASRLADKKINTLVEKRAAQIAKKEVRKSLYKNCVISPYGEYFTSGQCKHWNQISSEPSNTSGAFMIGAGFSATSVTVPDLRVPLQANQSVGTVLYEKMPAGTRRTNKVYVTGFKMQGLLRVRKVAAEPGQDWVKITLHESVLNNNAFPSGSLLEHAMTLDQIPPATGFMIDETDEDAIQRRKQQKVLHSRTYRLKTDQTTGDVYVPFKFQKFFKQPKMLFYDDTDLTGSAPYNRFLWCTVQASGLNESAVSEASIGLPTVNSPEICASCKLFYHEKPA